jgi:plasmid stability protein
MKSLHIRNLEEETLEGLKIRAKRHRRSLQKEVEVLLNDAARMVQGGDEHSPLDDLYIVDTGIREGIWTRDDIYGDDGR